MPKNNYFIETVSAFGITTIAKKNPPQETWQKVIYKKRDLKKL